MNRSFTIILLALIASYASAQKTNVSKTTDRLEAVTMLNYRDGAEYIKDMTETFRYEGFLEGKRWHTDYYEPQLPSFLNEKARKIRRKVEDEYYDKRSEMLDLYPEHDYLVMIRSSVDGPVALTYDKQDTALVLLKCYDMMPQLDKSQVKKIKMKVDVALYDSIQRLHLLATYTAVPMDPTPSNKLIDVVRRPDAPLQVMPSSLNFDTMNFHFVWGHYTGDLYARSHTCLSPTAKKLIETFYDICSCVTHQDREGLRKLKPTVSKLLSQYRKLLLPDVIVDEWTDEKFRF
ncbi:MAG: hypothetical protein IKY01_04835 [Prevotella sp.]|nr:hypothetical protein [Prevotella sp.]